jgi:type IV pilus assembly protein PilB
VMPSVFGEDAVLRILDRKALSEELHGLTLDSLGFEAGLKSRLRRHSAEPYGMLLVTGPTGSGKTTTLYSSLLEIKSEETKIITTEDPVEYHLEGINQTQVHAEIGLTFSNILRSILRQDPNIIMVGEIRDSETAEIVTRAALTGHMVLSTLHTNDAPSAITRLIDLGIEPFLIASCLRLIVAQRLVRKVCGDCSMNFLPDDPVMKEIGFNGTNGKVKKSHGCEKCNGTGYKGRVALFEILEVNNKISELITQQSDLSSIKKCAVQNGMKSLRQAGLGKIHLGVTTPEEVLRETSLDA